MSAAGCQQHKRAYAAHAHRYEVEHAQARRRLVLEEAGDDQSAAPQAAHRTYHVSQKPRVVVVTDGVADPRTVVIKARHTLVDS